MKTVTFYHSAICPRCHLASLWLARLIDEFPGIRVEKVELLTHRAQAREDGVRQIPALVSGSRRLSGFFLSRKALRGFLASL